MPSRRRPFWLRLVRGIGKTIGVLVGATLLCVSLIALAIHIPSVQRRLVATMNEIVTNAINFDVNVGYVYISWLDTIVMKDVHINDRLGHPMIAVRDLRVRFDIPSLLNHTIKVRAAYLDEASVQMLYQDKDQVFNINQFSDAILAAVTKPTDPYNPDPPAFTIQNVVIEHSNLIYSDPSQDTIRYGFDYLHEEFQDINITVEDFYLKGKFIGFNVKSLAAHERYSKLEIKKLSGYLGMDSTYMRLDRLDAHIGKGTHIKRSLSFKFRNWSMFKYFNDSILLVANLDTSYVDFDDLRAFAPDLPKLKERFWIKSRFSGYINNFKIKQLSAGFGQGSMLQGSVAMRGLPNWDTTRLEVNIKKSDLVLTDISRYLDTGSQKMVNTLGKMAFTGYYQGTPTNFKLFADAQTSIGMVTTNLAMHIKPDKGQTTYLGHIVTKDFDVGKLIDQPKLLQLADVNTDFDGRGFTQKSLNLALKGKADQFGLNGYSVKGIKVDGQFLNQTFNGLLSVHDPNLDGSVKGRVELGHKPEVVKVELNLKHANFAKFNLLSDITHLSGQFSTDILGLEPDAMRGIIKANNLEAVVRNRKINLSEVAIRKYWQDANQVLELESDWADMSLVGDYQLSKLVADVTALGKEYKMFFDQNPAQQRSYYAKKSLKINPYSLTIKVDIKDPKPVLGMYAPDVLLSNNTILNGSYTSGGNGVLLLNTEIDSLSVGKNLIQEITLDVNSSKSRTSSNILASAHLSSGNQSLFGLNPTNNLLLDVEWNNEKLGFRSHVDQSQPNGSIYTTANKLGLGGMLSFYEDRYTITFGESSLHLMDEDWRLDAENKMSIYYADGILIDQFRMGNSIQDIYAKGRIGSRQSDSLMVKVKELDLNILTSIIGKPIKGKANADIVVRAALATPDIHGFIKVDSLQLDKFLVGNVEGSSYWNNTNKWLNVDLDVIRDGARLLRLDGYYAPSNDSPINMTANVTGMPLKVMETFLGSIMSNWGGTATGKLALTGAIDKLVVVGALQVSGGVFKYDYLNANYRFNERIVFDKNIISLDNTALTDAYNQKAYIRKMRITHHYFQQYGIECEADLVNFQVMNTTAEQNPLYYGTVSASGPFLMRGQFDNLYIRGDLTSNKNTLVNIPIKTGSSESQKLTFIQFTDSQKPLSQVADSLKRKMDLEGITMDFNLNITPDAEIDIVFNAKNGEVIKAQGAGKLKLSIDTRGDFTMYGDYTISRGAYNFIFLNAVNKKFDLQRGSTLTWTGSPTGALMKISAKHTLNASLRPLIFSLDSATLQRPELRRKYPVTVNMDITGDMLKPNIVFGIEIERNYPTTISPDVTSFESRIQTDEQELNRQVFSLFLVRAFLPVNNVAGGSSDNLFASGSSATISEMLSNQISSLLSNVDENFSVDIDVNGWDQNALNALQLRLSYTLWEGRVRIARSGGVTNSQNQTTAASIAGDWQVEYMLSKDGIFRLRAFIRNNAALVAQGFNSSQQNTTTSGFTVIHTQSFDHIRELFTRPRAVMPLSPSKLDRMPIPAYGDPDSGNIKTLPLVKPSKSDTGSTSSIKTSKVDHGSRQTNQHSNAKQSAPQDVDKPKTVAQPSTPASTDDNDRLPGTTNQGSESHNDGAASENRSTSPNTERRNKGPKAV